MSNKKVDVEQNSPEQAESSFAADEAAAAEVISPPGTHVTSEVQTPAATKASGTGVSERKHAANRANAQHSTGPRTARGKACSRANALKAGLFDKVVLAAARQLDDYPEFEKLQEELFRAYTPRTLAAELRMRQLSIDIWRSRRAQAFELTETARQSAFFCDHMDKLTRFITMSEKVTERALAELAALDERAAAAARDETEIGELLAALQEIHDTDHEDVAEPRLPARKPPSATDDAESSPDKDAHAS